MIKRLDKAMKMLFGWLCYRIFMAYPHNWPRGLIWGFVLSWAGYYANSGNK